MTELQRDKTIEPSAISAPDTANMVRLQYILVLFALALFLVALFATFSVLKTQVINPAALISIGMPYSLAVLSGLAAGRIKKRAQKSKEQGSND